jgi:hypothetical protein
MANSLNKLMEKAFEDYFPKSKETKSKKMTMKILIQESRC